MDSKKYIEKELKTLAEHFPSVQIRYSFNKKIETHIVELTPIEEYNNNEQLDKYWISISLQFHKAFPNEEICFVSSDSSLAISNPELIYNEKYDAMLMTSDLYFGFLNCKIDKLILDDFLPGKYFTYNYQYLNSHIDIDFNTTTGISTVDISGNFTKFCTIETSQEIIPETQSLAA